MSQLNFFYTLAEIKEILNELYKSNEVLIFNGTHFSTESPEPESDLERLGDFHILTLWLINDYKQPACLRVSGVQLENQYVFDKYKDPIIEISSCRISDNIISPGRTYFKAGWIENE